MVLQSDRSHVNPPVRVAVCNTLQHLVHVQLQSMSLPVSDSYQASSKYSMCTFSLQAMHRGQLISEHCRLMNDALNAEQHQSLVQPGSLCDTAPTHTM